MDWKDIKGFEGLYQVSDEGLVRSLDRYHKGRYGDVLQKGKIITQSKDKDGYHMVALYKHGKRFIKRIHRIVYESFHGELKIGVVIDHIDNNKDNNSSTNLQQVSTRVNTSKDKPQRSDLPHNVYKQRGSYCVTIMGKYLGSFKTVEEAVLFIVERLAKIDNGENPTRKITRNTFIDGVKKCPICGQYKTTTEYYKNKYGGYQGKCKECYRIYEYNRRKK